MTDETTHAQRRLAELERYRDSSMEHFLRDREAVIEYQDLVAREMDASTREQAREVESNRYEISSRLREIEEIRDQDMNAYFRSPSMQAEYEDLVRQQQLIKDN